MTTRLDYVKWDEISETKQQIAKKMFQQLESFIDAGFGSSREKSLAITKLEESWMWIGKSIKVDQEKRNEELNKNLIELGLSPLEF